jgi:O-antigen ligase
MIPELPRRAHQWAGPVLAAAAGRVFELDRQDRSLKARMMIFGLALLLGFALGGLIVHIPPLYLFFGIGGAIFASLLVFQIEIAILLAILLRDWLNQFNYLGGDTALHPNGVMGVAIIAGAALFFVAHRIDPSRLRAFRPFLAFSALCLVSLLWVGEYFMDGLTVALRLLTALAMYAVLVYKLDSTRKINWVVYVIVAAQVLPTVQGLFRVAQGGGMDLDTAEIVRMGHSGQGAILAMILAFCLVQFLDAGTGPQRLLWGSINGLFAAGLFFTYGRAGWISFCVAVAFIGLMKHRKLLVIFPVIVILLITLVPTVSERFATIDVQRLDDRDSSTLAGRIEIWKASAEVYEKHPLLGVGYGVARYKVGDYLGQRAWMMHNDYLAVLVETGGIGLAVFIVWHAKWLLGLLRVRRTAQSAYEETLTLAVLAMLVASLVVRVTDNVLQTTDKLYPLVALVAAALALPRIRVGEEAETAAPVQPRGGLCDGCD